MNRLRLHLLLLTPFLIASLFSYRVSGKVFFLLSFSSVVSLFSSFLLRLSLALSFLFCFLFYSFYAVDSWFLFPHTLIRGRVWLVLRCARSRVVRCEMGTRPLRPATGATPWWYCRISPGPEATASTAMRVAPCAVSPLCLLNIH